MKKDYRIQFKHKVSYISEKLMVIFVLYFREIDGDVTNIFGRRSFSKNFEKKNIDLNNLH